MFVVIKERLHVGDVDEARVMGQRQLVVDLGTGAGEGGEATGPTPPQIANQLGGEQDMSPEKGKTP